ncbi:MAG TPA: MtrB/PioB family decaheme-associated outer membrane protein [Steroidobacteraceae bacterium]|nr:MtrB/PioB family decaheme-associated outer membrane protein [Steroidobacteraceae bacterium]
MRRTAATHVRMLLCCGGLGVCHAGLANDVAYERPDTSRWTCALCPPAARGARIEADVGAAHVSDAAARFGDYRGLEERGGYLVLGGALDYAGVAGQRGAVRAQDLGLASRELQAEVEWPGRLNLGLEYRALPRYLSANARTPFRTFGQTNILPSDWVRAGATTGMSQLDTSARAVQLSFDRAILQASSQWHPSPRVGLALDYRRDARNGREDITAAFVNLGAQLRRPIDDRTDTVIATLSFDGALGGGQSRYLGSLYTNKVAMLSWENPFTAVVPGADVGQLALAPDNSLHQLQGTWTHRMGVSGRLSINAAYGESQQDSQPLPYTTNSALALGSPPELQDASVATSHVSVRFHSDLRVLGRAWRGARVTFDARRDERNDRRPHAWFERVEGDSFVAPAVLNAPYDFVRQRVTAGIDYDLRKLLTFVPVGQRLTLSGGWQYESAERPQREVVSTRERSGWGRLAYAPRSWLRTELEVGRGVRELGRVNAGAGLGAGQNPLLRKYDLADRERQYAEFSLAVVPASDWSVLLSGEYASNDYINSRLGLASSRDRRATLASHKSIGSRVTMSAHYSWDRRTARQLGSQAFAMTDWSATTDDSSRTAGTGFRLDDIGGRAAFALDYSYSLAQGEIATDRGILPNAEFPTITHRTRSLSARLDYPYNRRVTVRAELLVERYDADDFAIDGVGPATIPTFLTLGSTTLDYDLRYVALSFLYLLDDEARTTR